MLQLVMREFVAVGVATLRCYTCENARDNAECNDGGPADCDPTMDTCQTIVAYSGTTAAKNFYNHRIGPVSK